MGGVVTLRRKDTIPRRGRQRNADGELAQKRKTSNERDRHDSLPHEAEQEEPIHRRNRNSSAGQSSTMRFKIKIVPTEVRDLFPVLTKLKHYV